MAVIAPSRLVLVLLLLAGSLSAQESKAVREQIGRVATALSDSKPEEAMTPFDKSFDDYSRLRDYFTALTNAYKLVSEMEVTDEQIANREATLTVHWILTMSDSSNGGTSEIRTEDLTFKLSQKKSDWRIVSVSPLDFFNPELRRSK